MKYQFVPYLWLSIIMVFIMLVLMGLSWKRRSARGVPFFMLSLILAIVWIAAQAMEIASVELPTKIIWANIQYISVYLLPVTYLYMILQFVGFDRWQKLKRLPILLLIVPIAVNILLWTNDYHGLIRQNVYLDTNGAYSVISKTYGPLFWVFAAYNFILTIFTLIVLANGIKQKTDLHRGQTVALFIGMLLPACSVAMHVTGMVSSRIDLTPLIIGFSGFVIFWGIFRYHLFDVVKIAHSMIIEEMSTGMILLDNEGGIMEINPAARDMLDITLQKPIGVKFYSLLEDFPQLIKLYEGRTDKTVEVSFENNGNRKYYEASLKQLKNPAKEPLGWILQIYNITGRKLKEEKIQGLASIDALTGLMNRGHFQKTFLEELDHAQISGSTFAVAYLDLDDFKLINDTNGHEAGDVFLRSVAERLKNVLRDSDIIARYGGDEFAILFPSIGDNENIELIGKKIFGAFEKCVEYNNNSIQIKASIGFSVYPRDGSSIKTLLNKADKAMYFVKSNQKNGICIYKEQ